MQILPSFDRFKALAGMAGLVPVWREFLFDVDTAVTAYSKLVEPPFGFLLESVVGGEQWARYSFLGTRPAGAWRLHRGAVSWWTPGGGWSAVEADDPLDDLDARLRARVPAEVPGLPRFWAARSGTSPTTWFVRSRIFRTRRRTTWLFQTECSFSRTSSWLSTISME